MEVIVRDNNVEQSMRILKRKMQREGVSRIVKLKRAYEKPSVRKKREAAESLRRQRKMSRYRT
ncbi:MAG: 30S ribosomal protein S21 [Holosporales bacterium]|nr:30S ribosomal protein S21 [Holosporales bacterium]